MSEISARKKGVGQRRGEGGGGRKFQEHKWDLNLGRPSFLTFINGQNIPFRFNSSMNLTGERERDILWLALPSSRVCCSASIAYSTCACRWCSPYTGESRNGLRLLYLSLFPSSSRAGVLLQVIICQNALRSPMVFRSPISQVNPFVHLLSLLYEHLKSDVTECGCNPRREFLCVLFSIFSWLSCFSSGKLVVELGLSRIYLVSS